MLRKSDIQWWIQEVRKDPASAPAIIEELANRLLELDAENERLRGELVRHERRDSGAPANNVQLDALQRKVSSLQSVIRGQASTETAIVLVSDQLEAARIPLSQVRMRLRNNEALLARTAVMGVRAMLLVRPQENVLLFTSRGRALQLALHKIPYLVDDQGWPAGGEQDGLLQGEQVTAATAVGKPPRFWSVVTGRGYVRQLLRLSLDQQLGRDEQVVKSVFSRDVPIALANGDRGDLLVVTRWGKAIRFPQRSIANQGSVALDVEPDDSVVAALSTPADSEILLLTAAGYAMRRDIGRFTARGKPGGAGRGLIQAFDVLAVFSHLARAKLLYLTYSGRFVLAESADIPLLDRFGKGIQLRDMERDPAVAVAQVSGALL